MIMRDEIAKALQPLQVVTGRLHALGRAHKVLHQEQLGDDLESLAVKLTNAVYDAMKVCDQYLDDELELARQSAASALRTGVAISEGQQIVTTVASELWGIANGLAADKPGGEVIPDSKRLWLMERLRSLSQKLQHDAGSADARS